MNIQYEPDRKFGDSDFLAMNDSAIKKFRESERSTKHKIINKMLKLRHNMKYNKHLLSVYVKAKELFDTMVEEHRAQLDSLDEIYRHLNQLIRENLSKQRVQKKKDKVSIEMMKELVKDKKKFGSLLKKMRSSYEKLRNIDTILGVTVDKINEITYIDDHDNNNKMTESEDDEEIDDEEDDDEEREKEEYYDDDEDEDEDHVDSDADDDRDVVEDEDEDEDDDTEDEEHEDDDTEEESEEDEDDDDDDDEEEEDEDEDEDEEEDEDDDDDDDGEYDNNKRAILVF